jgi:hypothetical protein
MMFEMQNPKVRMLALITAGALVLIGIGFLIFGRGTPNNAGTQNPGDGNPNEPAPMAGWKDYRSNERAFSLAYPEDWKVDEKYAYQALGPGKDIPGVSFTIPEDMTDGKNLSKDTKVSVEFLPKDAACDAQRFLGNGIAEEHLVVSQDGTQWSTGKTAGAGAGNFYEETVYAAEGANYCYGLRLFIHSTNIGNYEPGTVEEFDRGALEDVFALMRESFTMVK